MTNTSRSTLLNSTVRIFALDWLRVIAFGMLIFYHIGMLYAESWGWHYKSSYSSKFLTNIMLWSNQWRMLLLFFISGAAVSFLLAKKARWEFIRQRVPLLFLPLIFGMLVVVVPQVYVEANSTGVINCPNYWHFWYIYLDQQSVEFAAHKTIGSMQLTWNHLWFLPYLLAYTLILWSVYPILNSAALKRHWVFLSEKITLGWIVLVPILIFYLAAYFLYQKYPTTHNFVLDWFNHARSFSAFLFGFVLVRLPKAFGKISEYRWYFLLAASVTCAYIIFAFNGGSLGDSPLAKEVNGFLWSANAWLWILALIAWAQYKLNFTNPLLQYLNGGVFCFYIMHQTLIIVFAYWLVPMKLGALVESGLLLVLVPIGCVLIYELIKPVPVLRTLLGVHRSLK